MEIKKNIKTIIDTFEKIINEKQKDNIINMFLKIMGIWYEKEENNDDHEKFPINKNGNYKKCIVIGFDAHIYHQENIQIKDTENRIIITIWKQDLNVQKEKGIILFRNVRVFHVNQDTIRLPSFFETKYNKKYYVR